MSHDADPKFANPPQTHPAGFTLGPWVVDRTKALGPYGVWTEYATHPGHDAAGYGSMICAFSPRPGNEIPQQQREANAKLVAAAPDLFGACEFMLAWLCNCNLTDPATLGRQIMAAMEKAGYGKGELDDAAVALVRGPCSVPNMMVIGDD